MSSCCFLQPDSVRGFIVINTHTHTHTHTDFYVIYISKNRDMYLCVCIFLVISWKEEISWNGTELN